MSTWTYAATVYAVCAVGVLVNAELMHVSYNRTTKALGVYTAPHVCALFCMWLLQQRQLTFMDVLLTVLSAVAYGVSAWGLIDRGWDIAEMGTGFRVNRDQLPPPATAPPLPSNPN